jgi:hypothetical protein
LQKAARLSLETLQADLTALKKQLTSVGESLGKAAEDLERQMKDFIEKSHGQLGELEQLMEDVEKLGDSLATFFCEDPSSFKLETFLQLISKFVSRVKTAHEENVQRKLREEREEKRRKQKEEDDKRKKSNKAAQKSKQTAKGFVDRLLSGIRGGSKLRQQASAAKDVESPKSKSWSQLKKGLFGRKSSSSQPPVKSDNTAPVTEDPTYADSNHSNDQGGRQETETTQFTVPSSAETVVSNQSEHMEGTTPKLLEHDIMSMSVDNGLETERLSEGVIISGNKNVPEAWGDTTGSIQ